MTTTLDGRLRTDDRFHHVEFERSFDAALDEVWAVVSEPQLMEGWLGGPVEEFDLVDGGTVVILIHPKGPATVHGNVLNVETRRCIEFTWNVPAWRNIPDFFGTIMRWEVRPEGRGTTFALTHSLPLDAGWHVHAMLGAWHLHLDAVPAVLSGATIPRFGEADFFAMRDQYAALVGPIGDGAAVHVDPSQ